MNKVTIEDVEKAILSETYTLLPNGRTTVCQLTLIDNGDTGFTVEGQSACVSKENYNPDIGNKIARERALDQVWIVLGYDLAKQLDLQNKLESRTFLERMEDELDELRIRGQKLEAFFSSQTYHQLAQEDQQDLVTQYEIMKQYAQVLARRMARLSMKN